MVKEANPVSKPPPVSKPGPGHISSSSSILQSGLAYLIAFGIPAVLILVGVQMVADGYGDGMKLLPEYGATMLTSEPCCSSTLASC